MAEISRFYGLIIRIFFKPKEHNPPHLHVYYGDFEAQINIKTLEIMEGKLPNTAIYLVKQWTKIHQRELIEIWETQKAKEIEPLD
jgi:hypothetical protein